MTKIIVDADACPVIKDALSIARKEKVPVLLVGNHTQNLERHIKPNDKREPGPGFWVDTEEVYIGADSADFVIVENLEPKDIVVTQDIGLASMVLGRNAFAIGVRGKIYNPLTIDSMIFIRHEEKKVRRAGGRTKGPSAFEQEDRDRFRENLKRLISKSMSETDSTTLN